MPPQLLRHAAWLAFVDAVGRSGWPSVDSARQDEIERVARSSSFSMDYLWAAVAVTHPALDDASITERIAAAEDWRSRMALLPA